MSTENELVSIVCGVYKAEKYLDRLILSLINQTYKSVEIILCVNGSDDRSEEIVKNYEKVDSRIKAIYYSEKLGAGGGRQKAFLNAKGTYIAVVDCDDWVTNEYIAKLVEAAKKNGYPDLIIGGFKKIEPKKGEVYRRTYPNSSKALVQSVAPWGKLYRREFLNKNDINFLNIPFGEDVLFTAEVIIHNPSIAVIDEMNYCWFNRIDSTSHTEIRKLPEGTIAIADKNFRRIRNKTEDIDSLLYLVYKYYIWYILQSGRMVGFCRMRKEYNLIINTLNGFRNCWEKECVIQVFKWKSDRFIVRSVLFFLLVMRFLHMDVLLVGIYAMLPLDDRWWPKL